MLDGLLVDVEEDRCKEAEVVSFNDDDAKVEIRLIKSSGFGAVVPVLVNPRIKPCARATIDTLS